MPDITVPTTEAPEMKKPDKKLLGVVLFIVCGAILLTYLIATSLTSKKHTLTNQNQISQQNQSSGQTQGVQPLPNIDTIILTKNGFSPDKTAIKKGTAIKWTNDSGTDKASVNSDDYPTNQRFPELNLGIINKGSSVAHIFTTAGTYTYHNQFNPKQKGTIVVE